MWISVCIQLTKYGLVFMWHVVTANKVGKGVLQFLWSKWVLWRWILSKVSNCIRVPDLVVLPSLRIKYRQYDNFIPNRWVWLKNPQQKRLFQTAKKMKNNLVVYSGISYFICISVVVVVVCYLIDIISFDPINHHKVSEIKWMLSNAQNISCLLPPFFHNISPFKKLYLQKKVNF